MFSVRSWERKAANELTGEVYLAGVARLMPRRAFQQFQQRQAGEGVGRVWRSRRAGQLLRRKLRQQGAKPLVGGLLALQFLAEMLLAA